MPSREKLAEFAAWCRKSITGDEKGQAQIFLDRLFQAFGQPGCLDVGGAIEFRLRKSHEDGGGTAFADYVWKPVVLIEMKKRGQSLQNTTAKPSINALTFAVFCSYEAHRAMKLEHLSLGLLGLITSCSLAQDITFTNRTASFTNLQGTFYGDVTLVKADLDGLIWRSGASGGRISFTNLDSSLLVSFGIPVERVEQARLRGGQKAAADAEFRAAQVDVPTRDATAAPVVNFWQSYVTNYKVDLSTLDSDALAHMPNKAAEAMREQLQQELELEEIRNKGLLDVEANLHKEGLINEQQYANARLNIGQALAGKKRKLAEDEMQGEIDAHKAVLLESQKRQPALDAHMFNAAKNYLDVKERENNGDRRALALPRATTATNQVVGGFGFVLGEKFTNDHALAYSNYPAGWTHNKDGGYSCFSRTNKPFDSVSAWADDGGRICLVCGNASSDSPSELFKSTKDVLAARYPERYAETSTVVFGTNTRCVLLAQHESSVFVFYEDDELWHALQDRIKKAKEAAIRGALGEKP